MTPRLPALAAAALVALAAAAPAATAQAPSPAFVHAHRGGTTLAGAATFGEETLPAYRSALRLGSVWEMDAKLTKDGVPVLFHDATLDRVTPCTGRIDAKTVSELAACPIDMVGSPEGELGGAAAAKPEPISTLASGLAFARAAGATINLEIKNIPTDPDFDPTNAFTDAVNAVVAAAGLPPERVIIQSFWPPSLDRTQSTHPEWATSLLTQAGSTNDGGPAYAAGRRYTWISPQWPVDAAYVDRAHALGLKVVPYTVDTMADVAAAAGAGADAVITDDPLMTRRAIGIPDPADYDFEGPVITLRIPTLAWTSFRSEHIRLRWRGSDPAGLAGYEAEIRTANSSRWRTLFRGGRISIAFTGHPGTTYLARVRAQDALGNLGAFATTAFVIPFDERDRHVRLGAGWTRVKRANAWRGGVAQAAGPGAVATLRFSGKRLRVVGPRLAGGGRMEVRIDGRRRRFSVRGSGDRKLLFDSGRLRQGRHSLRIIALGGGPVALDALAPS